MGIDATTKLREEGFVRESQELAIADNETQKLVERKWKEYGFH
jgi:4-hydroxy-3-polyprenylbenzoate decarboxylase